MIITILVSILVFGSVIFIHELGHFATAKFCGIKVNEFSIGMGPALLRHQRGETLYALRLLPIGGYVAMAGEEGSVFEGVPHERTIKGVSHWKQIVIMLAGVVMNFVLAWLIFSAIILING